MKMRSRIIMDTGNPPKLTQQELFWKYMDENLFIIGWSIAMIIGAITYWIYS